MTLFKFKFVVLSYVSCGGFVKILENYLLFWFKDTGYTVINVISQRFTTRAEARTFDNQIVYAILVILNTGKSQRQRSSVTVQV